MLFDRIALMVVLSQKTGGFWPRPLDQCKNPILRQMVWNDHGLRDV